VLSPCGGRDDTAMVRFFPWPSITGVRAAILPLTLAALLAVGEAQAADPPRLGQGKFSLDCKIQATADMSPRYQSVSLGAGVWH
jgi:hypothetical protein